jgi:uncharacterized protein
MRTEAPALALTSACALSVAAVRSLRVCSLALVVALAPGLQAQPLTPPLGASGAGYHDPRSAFKPLQERKGVVSWALLSSVTTRLAGKRLVPEFPEPVLALDQKPVKIQGFMLPLEPGAQQRHFLLSAVPTTCSFCIPAGPEGLIEVRASRALKYTVEAITVEGRMAVLRDDPYGLYYRVSDATAVP